MTPQGSTPKRKVGNLLALAVLAYLSRRPMHPYELGRALQASGDARSVAFTFGSLYTVVGQLARKGFVAARETSRTGQRPERTVYEVTEAGRREAEEWLRDLVAEPRHEYPGFVTALSLLAAMPPAEAAELLRQRRKRIAERCTEARALLDGDPAPPVEEEYRLSMMEAEATFVDCLLARLTLSSTTRSASLDPDA